MFFIIHYSNRMSVYFCGGTARPMFMRQCESRASKLKHASEQKANKSGGVTTTIKKCCLGPLISQCEQPDEEDCLNTACR